MNTERISDQVNRPRAYHVRLQRRGQITLPQEAQEGLNLNAGDMLTLVDVGSMLFLTQKQPVVPSLADRIVELMEAKGVTLADLLAGLEEERTAIYEERWSQ